MKQRTLMYLLPLALLLYTGTALAQHSQHHPEQTTQPEQQMGGSMMMHQGMDQGMMPGPMMMHHLQAQDQEMQELMDHLNKNLSTLENQSTPEAMKAGLAEHRSLLEQLQGKMNERHHMMEQMMKQMEHCPMMQEKGQSSSE